MQCSHFLPLSSLVPASPHAHLSPSHREGKIAIATLRTQRDERRKSAAGRDAIVVRAGEALVPQVPHESFPSPDHRGGGEMRTEVAGAVTRGWGEEKDGGPLTPPQVEENHNWWHQLLAPFALSGDDGLCCDSRDMVGIPKCRDARNGQQPCNLHSRLDSWPG